MPPPPKQNKKHIASWTVNCYIAIIFQILLLSGKGKMEKKNLKYYFWKLNNFLIIFCFSNKS